MAAAQGQLICFADADDVPLPAKLEAQVAALDEDPDIGIVLARHELLVEPGGEAQAARDRSTNPDARSDSRQGLPLMA